MIERQRNEHVRFHILSLKVISVQTELQFEIMQKEKL